MPAGGPALLRYRPFRAQERQPPGWHRSRQDVFPSRPGSHKSLVSHRHGKRRPPGRHSGPQARGRFPCCPSSRGRRHGKRRPPGRHSGPQARGAVSVLPVLTGCRHGKRRPTSIPTPDRPPRRNERCCKSTGASKGTSRCIVFPLPDLDALPRENPPGCDRRAEAAAGVSGAGIRHFHHCPDMEGRSQPISTCDICTFQLPRRRSPFGARRANPEEPDPAIIRDSGFPVSQHSGNTWTGASASPRVPPAPPDALPDTAATPRLAPSPAGFLTRSHETPSTVCRTVHDPGPSREPLSPGRPPFPGGASSSIRSTMRCAGSRSWSTVPLRRVNSPSRRSARAWFTSRLVRDRGSINSRSATVMKAFPEPVEPELGARRASDPVVQVLQFPSDGRKRRSRGRPSPRPAAPAPLFPRRAEERGELARDRQLERLAGLGLLDPQDAPFEVHPLPAQRHDLAPPHPGVHPEPEDVPGSPAPRPRPRCRRATGAAPPTGSKIRPPHRPVVAPPAGEPQLDRVCAAPRSPRTGGRYTDRSSENRVVADRPPRAAPTPGESAPPRPGARWCRAAGRASPPRQ